LYGDGRSESHAVDVSTQIDDDGIFVLINNLEKSSREVTFPKNLNLIETVKPWENVHRKNDFFYLHLYWL